MNQRAEGNEPAAGSQRAAGNEPTVGNQPSADNQSTAGKRDVAALKRWHRRIGVLAALLVIFVAFTGFALNHAAALQLDRLAIRSPTVLGWYGVVLPETLSGFAVGERWVSRVGERLFLDGQPVADCRSELVGAVVLGEEVVAACARELLSFSTEGLLLDRIDATYRLPVPVAALGTDAGKLVLRAHGQVFGVDLETPQFQPRREAGVAWSRAAPLPPALVAVLAPHAAGDELTLERLVLDLHSGRLLGSRGVWLMDALAVALVLLALSGLMAWRREQR